MLTSQCRCGGELEMRRKKSLSGADGLVWQCIETSCNRIHGPVASRDLLDIDPALVPIAFNWVHQVPKKRPNSRKRAYQAALHSPHWKALRVLVFERSNGKCEVEGCGAQATELGHLSYERLGAELPEDVQANCGPCNQREREKRITSAVLGPR